MKTRLPAALAALLLSACGIDFVAVEDVDADPIASVVLRSEHGETVEASLGVLLSRRGAPPVVLLGGSALQAEEDGEFWEYRATPVVDTLQPRFELEIQVEQGLSVQMPFVTRMGPAVWRPNGDLELPVAYGGDASDPQLRWSVELVDSDGRTSLRINSNRTPLPRPIVLPAALIPPGATAAYVTVGLDRQPAESIYRVAVSIRGEVIMPIPGGG
jgi:hypothetical protein